MELVTIGGVAIPDPTEIEVAEYDLSANAQRALDGTFSYDYIGKKRTLTLRWSILKASDWSAIQARLPDGQFVTVTWQDATGTQSATMYRGDRRRGLSVGKSVYYGGEWWWTDVELTLIEV